MAVEVGRSENEILPATLAGIFYQGEPADPRERSWAGTDGEGVGVGDGSAAG
jgi:hypothetical protein